MRLKWLDIVLIVLIVVGAVQFVRVQATLSELHRAQARIVQLVGEMKIDNPDAMHLKALETEQPWQWTWRVYRPENVSGTISYVLGSSGSGGSSGFGGQLAEFMGRVAMTKQKSGHMAIYSNFMGSSSLASFGSPEFAEYLQAHRDELIVEQAGKDEITQIASGDPPVMLFRLSLPPQLAEEARQKFGEGQDKTFIPVIMEMKIESR